ncbi:hypothetical protein BKA82DRAFT_1000520 [Pisolithus tinctorius]|uniref:BSD domain-containing protein n=1 Tax=Pisolithus tinctorius Marx 270 TaxID=870435 RepID=A0A0C3K4B0_PISTI|nr:hypothetical protein BKA82DRAFT_1000520 [Pisolithus tinctorius]KIO04392.1 hypothetical protein M404DRAFT_1000520 [Pisolithus tinctorius Marx 270]
MPAIVCTAKASYKKQLGTLEFTDTHLQWTQDGKKAPSVKIPLQDAASLFCSKEGAAQVRLKLGLVNDDAGHNFTFSSEPQTVALAERETFKSELTNVISRNRSGTGAAPPPPGAVTPKPPVTANASLASSKPSTPLTVPVSRASASRATSVASDGRSPLVPGADAASDFRLRKKVLMSNPELLALHKDLVMTGQITESEFWEGREHLLLAQAAVEAQKRGRPGQLVDPRPQTVEGGEVKIVITPQLVHDIFEEYPVVAKAYSENVPSKLSEAEFWKRYFQSKLFNAHRASIRSSATQHVVKDDPIFDKYLEKDDDGLEPKRPREEVADLYISLGATLEDHAETGNERDITMRAGRQRGVLPLIRKFNDHSERLLNSTLGDSPPLKRQRAEGDSQDSFSQIELEDLRDPESSIGILLEMQDRQRYFEGQLMRGVAAEQAPSQPVDVSAAYANLRRELEGWDVRFNQLRLERKAADTALLSMTQNVTARLDTKTKKNSLPPALFRQLTTCQTAANEFLRQFWGATCPPPTDTPFAPSPAQRSAKAAKMASYLAGTREKVDALVRVAQAEGVDGTAVEVAMKPVLDAVEHALAFYRTKNPPRATQHKLA